MQARCMLCGRLIEIEEVKADLDEDEDEGFPKKSSLHVCQLCQAKLKHEADEFQKNPKPM